MVLRDTQPGTQESGSGDSSEDKRWKEFMEEWDRKIQRQETDIDGRFIDGEPVSIIADMVRHVSENCPHLVQLCEDVDTEADWQSIAANTDTALHEMGPDGLYDVAKEIKDNYYEWNEGRLKPLTGSRVPHADSRVQYLYESMMGSVLPEEFFDKMAVASVHFNYVYHPDSPQSQIYQQMRLNSERVSGIDELQEETLRIADESLYDAVKLVIGKKEHVIRGVFCKTDNYYPQLVTRMVTTLEADMGLPQGTLLERVKMDDLFHRIKEDLGPRTSTKLSRY